MRLFIVESQCYLEDYHDKILVPTGQPTTHKFPPNFPSNFDGNLHHENSLNSPMKEKTGVTNSSDNTRNATQYVLEYIWYPICCSSIEHWELWHTLKKRNYRTYVVLGHPSSVARKKFLLSQCFTTNLQVILFPRLAIIWIIQQAIW